MLKNYFVKIVSRIKNQINWKFEMSYLVFEILIDLN